MNTLALASERPTGNFSASYRYHRRSEDLVVLGIGRMFPARPFWIVHNAFCLPRTGLPPLSVRCIGIPHVKPFRLRKTDLANMKFPRMSVERRLHVAKGSHLQRKVSFATSRQVAVSGIGQEQLVSSPTASVPEAESAVSRTQRKKQQPQDFTALAAVVEEVRRDWTPAKIENVVQVDAHTLVLSLRTMKGSGYLYLSWHPNTARLCLGGQPARKPAADLFSYGESMRKFVKGLCLVDLGMAPWERVVQLQLAARPVDKPTRNIIVEVMGRHSNIVTCTPDNEIISCAYQVGHKQTRVRPLSVGGVYTLPPQAEGLKPELTEEFPQWCANIRTAAATSRDGSLNMGMVRAYVCVSPSLATELALCAGLDPKQKADALTTDQYARLHVQWQRWLTVLIGEEGDDFRAGRLKDGSWTVLYKDGVEAYEPQTATPDGQVAGGHSEMNIEAELAAMSKNQRGEGWLGEVSPINAMLDKYYTQLSAKEKFTQLHQVLLTKVQGRVRKVREKVRGFEERLADSEEYDKPKELADMLMANVHRYDGRAEEMIVEDFSGTGNLVTIPIDPFKGPIATAQGLYKRSQKLRRSAAALEPLLEEGQAELDYLLQMEVTLEQTSAFEDVADLQMLEDVRDEIIQAGYMRKSAALQLAETKASGGRKQGGKLQQQGKKGAALKAASEMSGTRKFVSPGGLLVLVGKNNRGNEHLTHNIAANTDLWFHVHGIPGSHTLLRLQAGQEPSEEDVQFAANLAAYFSRARGSTQSLVDYVSPKYIGRAKGGHLGMVTVKQNSEVKTIWARPDDVQQVAEADS